MNLMTIHTVSVILVFFGFLVALGDQKKTCRKSHGVCKRTCDVFTEVPVDLPGCCRRKSCCVEACPSPSPPPTCPVDFEIIPGLPNRAYKFLVAGNAFEKLAECESLGEGVHAWYPETPEEREAILNFYAEDIGDQATALWTSMRNVSGVIKDDWCNSWPNYYTPPYSTSFSSGLTADIIAIPTNLFLWLWADTSLDPLYPAVCEVECE